MPDPAHFADSEPDAVLVSTPSNPYVDGSVPDWELVEFTDASHVTLYFPGWSGAMAYASDAWINSKRTTARRSVPLRLAPAPAMERSAERPAPEKPYGIATCIGS